MYLEVTVNRCGCKRFSSWFFTKSLWFPEADRQCHLNTPEWQRSVKKPVPRLAGRCCKDEWARGARVLPATD